jgi:predicted Zn-dependent protease
MRQGLFKVIAHRVQQGLWAVVMMNLLAPGAFAQETIGQMVDRLCAANKIPRSTVKQAVVKNSKQINAGTDGQSIVVYSGLWDQLATDDARAFVVGHELGHIVLNHVMKGTGRRVGLQVLSRLATGYLSPLAGTAAYYGLQLTGLKFDRGQEYQADEEGLRLMWRAGYDPHAMNQVFGVLSQSDSGSGGPEFLRTHPLSQKRLQELLAKYDRLGPPTRQNGGLGMTASPSTASFALPSTTATSPPPPVHPFAPLTPSVSQPFQGNLYNATPPASSTPPKSIF